MSLRALHILLIEDHADSALAFARVLQRDGHKVNVVGSAAEAEGACAANPFDLLLCDLELPDGTGFHLLEHARRSCPKAQGIVISAHDDDAHRRAARQAGFEEYLLKPFRAEVLRAAMERVMRSHPLTSIPAMRPMNAPLPG
jgi:DNA-binding response OmpR family regulator